MASDDILLETEEKMAKTLHKVEEDFQGVRTGKASAALVENIRVEAYGSTMRLKELAGITAPEPRLLVIQPWDAATLDPVRKALEESQLGITPQVDGKLIRLPIPQLSEERRRDLIKLIGKMAEDGRVALRHERRHGLEGLKKEQKDGKITEDELSSGEKEIQKLTDQHVAKIDLLVTTKEADLLKV